MNDPQKMENIIRENEGFQMLKSIRTSPAYWRSKQKDSFAMMRQLGCPSLFLTVSCSETRSPEILSGLYENHADQSLNQNLISPEQALFLDDNTKTQMVRDDPMFTAMMFEDRVKNLMDNLKHPYGIFTGHPMIDYIYRIEFQKRGSAHIHCISYNENVPKYDSENPDEFIRFIDEFITCEYVSDDSYMQFQRHKHTPSCYKGFKNKTSCRFHFPKFVMDATCDYNFRAFGR